MRLTSSSSITSIVYNLIGGVMVSVLASSAVERGFEPRSGQTKDYLYLLLFRYARSIKEKESARNQTNLSEWSEMSTRGLLFQ